MPGNPVSCYVCSEIYLLPSLRKAMGISNHLPVTARVHVGEVLKKSHGKTAFIRARLSVENVQLVAHPTGAQESNIIRSLAGHDGYIIFPAECRELAAGDAADFIVGNHEQFGRCAAQIIGWMPRRNEEK
jgi:molybdopterin molybdotransferase